MEPSESDQQLAALIGEMLAALPVSVQKCFTVETIREVLTTSLDDWAQARAEHPGDGQRPLWDLRMDDSDYENAAFVVWIWEEEAVWLGCGTGHSFEVRHFCDQRAACECCGLFAAMRNLFQMPVDPLSFPSRDIERWINRTWNEQDEPPE